MNVKLNHTLFIGDIEIQSIDLDNDFISDIKRLCPNNSEKIFADIFPYFISYKILKVIGEESRMEYFDTDVKFRHQIRKVFEMLQDKTVNYIRKYIGTRIINQLFFENVIFNKSMDENLGLPVTIEYGSEEYQVWNNFLHCSAKHSRLITDLLNMTSEVHLSRYRTSLLRACGEKRLLGLHDEVTTEYNKIIALIQAEKLKKPFPVFKKSLADGVTQLANGEELLNEGQIMHHCVASYVDTCLRGDSHIFHVEYNKKQATLELSETGTIKQFKSFHNDAPSPEIRTIVDTWLSDMK